VFWCYAVLDLGDDIPIKDIGRRYECRIWPRKSLSYSTWVCRYVGCDAERFFVSGDYLPVASWLGISDIVKPTLEAYGISPWSWERHPGWQEIPPLSGDGKSGIEVKPRKPGPW